MARDKSDSEKRADRRKRRRERYRANNWRLHPTAPTPWEDWDELAESYRDDVRGAVEGEPSDGEPLATYRQDAARPTQPIYLEDLALALFAVTKVGKKSIGYGQLQHCFKRWGKSCHRSKCARMLKKLVELNLIIKTGNYSTGRRGNIYKIVRPNKEDDMRWLEENIGGKD